MRYCEDRGSERRGEERTGELRRQWASEQDTGDLKTVRYCTDRRDSVIEAEELRERKAPNSKREPERIAKITAEHTCENFIASLLFPSSPFFSFVLASLLQVRTGSH